MVKALITGASSGIGLEMAKILAKEGHELILVARDKEKLQKIQDKLGAKVKIIVADLSNESKLKEVYILTKNEKIDILINNAGFGDCGYFDETDLSKEMEMIIIFKTYEKKKFWIYIKCCINGIVCTRTINGYLLCN